ncbi:MAG TPA: L-seryl-tRNA(Sec) selenium transferase, partial [Limnochordia bacterium]|nr:L-seryl-tRNA(Sec) selenium transferase [Limnochordia bacterium]
MSAGALGSNPYRALPSVDELVRTAAPHLPEAPRAELVDAARAAIQGAREALAAGGAAPVPGALLDAVLAHCERLRRRRLQRVINATGVVLHTNFGRAPLPEAALRAVADVCAGYSNLEFDLDVGARGRRDGHCAAALCRLSGAEAALVVNNTAAALLLVLSALCAGR